MVTGDTPRAPHAVRPAVGTNWKPGVLSPRDPAGSGAGAAARGRPAPRGAALDLGVSGASEKNTYLGKNQSQGWKKIRGPTTSSLNPVSKPTL